MTSHARRFTIGPFVPSASTEPSSAAAAPGSAARRLRGRTAELEAIGHQVGRLLTGEASITLISGAPGMGRTRLLEEAVRIGERIGARTGAASAEPGDGAAPFGLLMTALFAGREPVLDRAALADLPSAPEQRYWLVAGLTALLERASARQPVVIALDDLHRADDATVAAVAAIAAQLAGAPIAWVATTAEAHARGLAARLACDVQTATVVLGPLGDGDVLDAVTDAVGAEPGTALRALAADAGGNAFWLAELLAGLEEEGRLADPAPRLPRRVHALVRERLSLLSDEARLAAAASAALGRSFTFEALARMLERSSPRLLGPVEELVAADVLVERDGALEFRYNLLRDAVLDGVPGAARLTLQREAVTVLLAGGVAPVAVAEQLAATAGPGDVRAIDVLVRAVASLGATDPHAGARLGQRTLKLLRREDPRRGALIAETATLLHDAGHPEVGRSLAERALAELLPVEHEAEVLLGIAGMFSLPPAVRVAAGRRAFALSGLGDGESRARHRVALAYNLIACGERAEAEALCGADALAAGALAHARGAFGEALGAFEDGVRRGAPAGGRARAAHLQQWRVETLAVLDRRDEAGAACADGLAAARRDGQAAAAREWEQLDGRLQLQAGELRAAIATLEALGTASPLDAPSLAALARAALHAGDQRLLDSCAMLASQRLADGADPEERRHLAWLLAQQALAAGDARRGVAMLAAVRGAAQELPLPALPGDPADAPQLVRLALAAGDGALAEQACAHALELAERHPEVASIQGAAAHAAGLLDEDAAGLDSAVAALAASPRRLALASAIEDQGALAVRAGDVRLAVERYGAALELAVALDATWDATRLRARLRTLGVRRRLARTRVVAEGWEALSPSERAIALAVTRGMTNREVAEHLFISPHTVNSHLRNVFAKLDINSRVDLARIASAHA